MNRAQKDPELSYTIFELLHTCTNFLFSILNRISVKRENNMLKFVHKIVQKSVSKNVSL